MALSDRFYAFAVSPTGRSVDRGCVRWWGRSPFGTITALQRGVPYNPHVLLTTSGRKSGRPHSVVLPCFPCPRAADAGEPVAGEGGVAIAVVGSRGGRPTDPHWVRNLRAEPRCWVRERRVLHRARARIADGAERKALWRAITERAPIYLEYQERARGRREIPVVVLELAPVGAEGRSAR